jgi:hypothetical protein
MYDCSGYRWLVMGSTFEGVHLRASMLSYVHLSALAWDATIQV